MTIPPSQPCAPHPILALFSLAFLLSIPGTFTHPHFPATILSTLEHPDWEATLLQLQASLDVPRAVGRPWGPVLGQGPGDPRLEMLRVLLLPQTDAVRRGQRGELESRPMGPFPGHPLESLHYQEGGEEDGEAAGKRNEALTSIAGGLQAFNREKGGFGFRFGRK